MILDTFMCLFAVYIFFFKGWCVYSDILPIFKFFFLLLLSYKSSFSSLDTSTLSEVLFTNIFFCLWLIFNRVEFFNYNLSVILFMDHTFVFI